MTCIPHVRVLVHQPCQVRRVPARSTASPLRSSVADGRIHHQIPQSPVAKGQKNTGGLISGIRGFCELLEANKCLTEKVLHVALMLQHFLPMSLIEIPLAKSRGAWRNRRRRLLGRGRLAWASSPIALSVASRPRTISMQAMFITVWQAPVDDLFPLAPIEQCWRISRPFEMP